LFGEGSQPLATEESLRDELTQLRSDLHDAWQRLESLELLLRQANEDSEPESAPQTAGLGLDEADPALGPGDDAESAARQVADENRESDAASDAEASQAVAETGATEPPADTEARPIAEVFDEFEPADGLAPTDSSERPERESDDAIVDHGSSADDQAIREYMERLLLRVGGGAAPRTDSTVADTSREDRDLTDQVTLEDEPIFPSATDEHRYDSQQADGASALDEAPTHPSPWNECSETDEIAESVARHGEDSQGETDLRAMRALANVAAKTVIFEFESKQHAKLAMDKLLVMLVCLPCGMLLLYWYSVHRLGVAYIAASIAFFAVAIWGAQAVRFLAKLTVARWSLARLWRDPVTRD